MKRVKKTGMGMSLPWAFLLAVISASSSAAQTTAFTYQGRLTEAGNSANRTYDLQFKLFDTPTPGTGTQLLRTIFRSICGYPAVMA